MKKLKSFIVEEIFGDSGFEVAFILLMLCAVICFISLFSGCATTPRQIQDVPPNPTVAQAMAVSPEIVQQPVTNPQPVGWREPVIYPDDATNYTWQVQDSTNLLHWVTWPTIYLAPTTNSEDVIITNTDMQHFYRMIGTHI